MISCIDIDAAVTQAVDESIAEFFRTMLNVEVAQVQQHAKVLDAPGPSGFQQEISTLVGLSGDLTGAICVSMDKSTAFTIVRELMGNEYESIDQTVVDGVGEVGNIVTGGAKRRLSETMRIQSAWPTVVLGSHECLLFPATARLTTLHYRYRDYDFVALIGVSS